MSDTESKEVPMAECGSCRAIIPLDSKKCSECGIGFSGVSDQALGECGACNALVPIESKSCPECGVYFVADDVITVLSEWFDNTGIEPGMLFSKFDSDSDGFIDAEELKDGLLKMNLADLPSSQIDRLISEVDSDNDGVISLHELVTAISGEEVVAAESTQTVAKQYSENVVERILKKFAINDRDDFLSYAAAFDENENDYLTEVELKKAAEAYSTDNRSEIESVRVTDEEDKSTDVDSDALSEDDENTEDEVEVETSQKVEDSQDDSKEDDTLLEDDLVEEESIEGVEDRDDSSDEYLKALVVAASEQDMSIRSMFESLDLDEDGLIDGPELQKGINTIAGDYLSPGDIMGIISLVDNDSDGRINAYELIEVIESMDVDIESDVAKRPFDLLTEFMDSLEINVGSFFRKLDKNGDGKINRVELTESLKKHAGNDTDDSSISELIDMFDDDGDEAIDLIEFITTIEDNSDEEVDERASLSSPKEFPSKWQKRMISKRWKDVVWPLIHTGFAFFILLWVVNGTLAPFVDGNGGTVILDTEFGQTIGEDNTVYVNGEPYPCDDAIQIGGCENSLTPFAGEGGELSMPAGFYWDGILFIILGSIGLIGSLFTQLSLVPSWRAKVKAMRENEVEKAEVAQALDDESNLDDEDSLNKEVVTELDDFDGSEELDETGDEDYDDEIDIGSYIGLVLEDEEVYGTIIEFDDDEGLVTIEEDGTGDLVTGYQDDMFLED
ncbi:MAG: hypothetical protein CMB43_02635 [Euryarchaeota archaeon]|nr:hypothetical protein [Euryarchaeota archaeon]